MINKDIIIKLGLDHGFLNYMDNARNDGVWINPADNFWDKDCSWVDLRDNIDNLHELLTKIYKEYEVE